MSFRNTRHLLLASKASLSLPPRQVGLVGSLIYMHGQRTIPQHIAEGFGSCEGTVGVGTILIWEFCVAYTRGGGGGGG